MKSSCAIFHFRFLLCLVFNLSTAGLHHAIAQEKFEAVLETSGRLRPRTDVIPEKYFEIPKGSRISVLGRWENGFCLVMYESMIGYLNEYNLSPNDLDKLKKTLPYAKSLYAAKSITAGIQGYVEEIINEWQKKGEFEKTSDYNKRVNEKTRKRRINEAADHALVLTKEFYKLKIKQSSFSLSPYDADNETFLVKTKEFGEFPLKVPIGIAPKFKADFSRASFGNIDFILSGDKFYISRIEFGLADSKQLFVYDSKKAATYENIDITYNFAPVVLDLNDGEGAKKKENPEKKSRKPADVDVDIPGSGRQNKNYFAVVIGNENYSNEIKVSHAINDARIVKEYFSKVVGVPPDNLHYVEDATYGKMLAEAEWINSVTKAFNGKTRIYFYYAGHGMPDLKNSGSYLLPTDGKSSISMTSLKTEDLYSKLTESNPELVTVFLDACFSGSSRNGILEESRGVTIKPKRDLLTGNIVVFSATSGDETAFPYDEKQHGLFTYFLLKKTKESRGNVKYGDLIKYLKESVNQRSVISNEKSQNPDVNTSQEMIDVWEGFNLK